LLCDLMEGVLTAEESRRVRERLAETPEWARRVARMESQRRVLAALPEEPTPPDLLDRVQAALEREALLGLMEGGRAASPVAVVMPAREKGVLARLAPRLWRPLAAAAGIALVALGGTYWVRNLSIHAPGPVAHGPLAGESLAESEGMGAIAMTDGSDPAAVTEPEETLDTSAPTERMLVAEPAAPGLSPARALALAREGRLLVRVVADRASTAAGAIEAIASLRGDPFRGITVEREVPAEVLAAVSVPAPAVVGPSPRARAETALAMERPVTAFDPLALVPPGVLSPWLPVEIPPGLGRTFVLELPGTAASMETMQRVLSARVGKQVRVMLEELAAPAVPPPLDAASLLWWTGPASTWAPRVAVPLVVEQSR
jgi:hypothetical protein